jgi:hypothetical protein
LISKGISTLCTLLAFPEAMARKARPGPRTRIEETMQKANKKSTPGGAVCIANDGAAARCALGLLVVVVLLLSH